MMIPVEKNKTYEIKIAALGSNGEGIGRIEGYTVFVEGALPSETCRVLIVKTRKHFGYGKLLEILTPSPDRREPCCPVAKQCGGCQLQHLSYAAQLAYKTKEVQDDLERIGGITGVTVRPAIGMDAPWRYRNKAQFPVGQGKDGCSVGFYAKRSHRIVDTKQCFLQNERNDAIVALVRDFLNEFQIPLYDEETQGLSAIF
jgi:23S rRNA (uracil1939-C5)-methyltransferase